MEYKVRVDAGPASQAIVDIQPLLDYASLTPTGGHGIGLQYIILKVLLRLVKERTHG